VELVHNPRLQKKYELQLDDLEGSGRDRVCNPIPELARLKVDVDTFGRECQEHLLFHGAPKETLDLITTGGLDPRRGGEAAGRLFGHASYLASNASKADLYTDASLRQPGAQRHAKRQILVMRTALGACHRTKVPMSGAMRPPDEGGRPMDSVLAVSRAAGGCVDHIEVMVYHAHQMIPAALVTYAHQAACECACCQRRL